MRPVGYVFETLALDYNFEPETLAGHPKYEKTRIVA